MSWLRIAVHEAGHAVVALLCRREIVRIWTTEIVGRCETHPVEWEGGVALARSELFLAVAGNIAERLHFGGTIWPSLPDGQIAIADSFADPESDEARAARAAKRIVILQTPDRTDAVAEIKNAEIAVRRTLTNRWCELIVLASSILQRQGSELTGEEINKILPIQKAQDLGEKSIMNEAERIDPISLRAEPPPLRLDECGAIRVGKSRITLDLIVEQYENGMTPEDLVRAYDTLDPADVHAVIAYYLRHKDAVRPYLKRREEEAAILRAKIDAERPRISREELLARHKVCPAS